MNMMSDAFYEIISLTCTPYQNLHTTANSFITTVICCCIVSLIGCFWNSWVVSPVQVHIWGHSPAGGTVAGHEPAQQCSTSEDPPLPASAWRSAHPGDCQQCHHSHCYQPVSPSAGSAPSLPHVPQCECLSVWGRKQWLISSNPSL